MTKTSTYQSVRRFIKPLQKDRIKVPHISCEGYGIGIPAIVYRVQVQDDGCGRRDAIRGTKGLRG